MTENVWQKHWPSLTMHAGPTCIKNSKKERWAPPIVSVWSDCMSIIFDQCSLVIITFLGNVFDRFMFILCWIRIARILMESLFKIWLLLSNFILVRSCWMCGNDVATSWSNLEIFRMFSLIKCLTLFLTLISKYYCLIEVCIRGII